MATDAQRYQMVKKAAFDDATLTWLEDNYPAPATPAAFDAALDAAIEYFGLDQEE